MEFFQRRQHRLDGKGEVLRRPVAAFCWQSDGLSILQNRGPRLRHRFQGRHARVCALRRNAADRPDSQGTCSEPAWPTAPSSGSAISRHSASQNDVVIGLEQKGQGDEALDAGKQQILDVLHKTFGTDNIRQAGFQFRHRIRRSRLT